MILVSIVFDFFLILDGLLIRLVVSSFRCLMVLLIVC